MEEQKEIWKAIPEFSRYEISEHGVVTDTIKKAIVPTTWNGNFLCLNLIRDDGTKVLAKVHRLVARTYLENTNNAYNVVHVDSDRANNHYTNLFWKAKIVKEKVEVIEPTFEHKGEMLTKREISAKSGLEVRQVTQRLKDGWSVAEIIKNQKDFKGAGCQTGTHWFPTKSAMEYFVRQEENAKKELLRKQKREKNKLEKELRKAQTHFGVGVFVNYPIQGIIGRKPTKTYSVWQGMIARCYNVKHDSYENYGGAGVRVCDEWLQFQNFAEWYEAQPKYARSKASWHIDKDILSEGEIPSYNPNTCVVVPPEVNTFFIHTDKDCVVLESGNLWNAAIAIMGFKHQRSFETKEEALTWYLEGKRQAARVLLWSYDGLLDSRVVDKLLNV